MRSRRCLSQDFIFKKGPSFFVSGFSVKYVRQLRREQPTTADELVVLYHQTWSFKNAMNSILTRSKYKSDSVLGAQCSQN